MLVKVTTTIETIVKVDNGLTRMTACDKAKECVIEDNFGVLQADLQVCCPNEVKLTAKPVTKKSELSEQGRNWFAWNSDGSVTSRTCGEILTC